MPCCFGFRTEDVRLGTYSIKTIETTDKSTQQKQWLNVRILHIKRVSPQSLVSMSGHLILLLLQDRGFDHSTSSNAFQLKFKIWPHTAFCFSLCLNALKHPNGSNCYQTFLQTLTDFVKTVVSWVPHWLCIDALMASFNIFVKPNLFPVPFVPFWWEMFQFIYYEGETMVKSS